MDIKENGIKNFEDFFRVKIAPLLPELQQADTVIRQWRMAAIISGIVLGLFIIASLSGVLTGSILATCVTAGGIAAISFYNYVTKDNEYVDKYKGTIILSVIEYLHPGLEYKPDSTVTEKEYRQSGLYRRNYDYFEGGDLIKGVYKRVPFHCSELHTKYDGGRRRNRSIKIFKGLFFSAPVSSKFKGGTYVWVKGREQLGLSIADEAYRLIAFPETRHFNTGNSLFDSFYSVYTTNVAEAAALLNSEMMNDLIRFRNQVQRNVAFSVVMGKCYVAIPVKEDLFEPSENPDNREEIKQYFFSVLLILSIINQLNLSRLQ
jgi:Protein of unknown function (DUF3137)